MSQRRTLWLLLGVVAVAATGALLPLDEAVRVLVKTMQSSGAWGVAVYGVVYLLATVLLIPGSLVTLAAGMVYGPWWGLVVVSPVSTLSAIAAFGVARRLGRERLKGALEGHPRLRTLDAAVQRDASRLVLLLRLSPLIPFNVLNYALGLAPVRLGTFTLASWVGMLPGTLLYTTLGASIPDLTALLQGGLPANGPLQSGVWWAGLVATAALTWWLARAAASALGEALPDAAEEGLIAAFAKPPVPGEVKTRLSEALTPETTTELARAFLDDTLTELSALPWARVVVASTTAEPFDSATTPTWDQGDGDLGDRVERILQRALDAAPMAFAVGTDAPGLTRAHLEDAKAALTTHDAVLGPASDGGFYLLGLFRCPDGLLADLPWSQSDTCARTQARLQEHGFTVAHLAPLPDIDRPDDLPALEATVAAAPGRLHRTRRWLRARSGAPLRVSVILPVLDEARRIDGQLMALSEAGDLHEILVVDGGSTDDTVQRAEAHEGVRVLTSTRGRGAQMNAGAAQATGDVLLFLHADVRLPPDALTSIRDVMARPDVVAGAFGVRTVCDDEAMRRAWVMPLLKLGDLRPSYTRLPYGDQALFVDASVFARLGGYPELPLMEDLELSRRLSRVGHIARVPTRVEVSGRRYLRQPLRSVIIMNTFPLLYALGVSPARLARWYAAIR